MTTRRVILPVGLSTREADDILAGWLAAGLRWINGVDLASLVVVPALVPCRAGSLRARPGYGTTRGARYVARDRR